MKKLLSPFLALILLPCLILGTLTPVANASIFPSTVSIATDTLEPLTLSLSSNISEFGYFEKSATFESRLSRSMDEDDDSLIYINDITDNRIVAVEFPLDGSYSTTFDMKFPFGPTHYYQAILAKPLYNPNGDLTEITKKSDLSNIVTTSNTVSLSREPWLVELSVWWEDNQVEVWTNHQGGGEYTTYLVDDRTKKIFWSEESGYNNDSFPINPHPETGVDELTAYVAQKWPVADGGNGVKPINESDLVDIQADSDGFSLYTGSSGVKDQTAISGGYNPSMFCAQACYGDPINIATGEFFENSVDLKSPSSGTAVAFARSFSTINKNRLTNLGYGWSSNYSLSLLIEAHKVIVTQDNGSTVTFQKTNTGDYITDGSVMATLKHIDGKYVFVSNKKVTFVFDNNGKLLQEKDNSNREININYVNGKINTVSDSSGNVLIYTYTGDLVTKISDNRGQTVVLTYNVSKKHLTSVKDSNNVIFYYTYDTQNRVKTLTNSLGGITTNTYDGDNRVTQQKDPLGRITKFAYDNESLNQNVTVTHPDKTKTLEKYRNGQLYEKVENFEKNPALTTKYFYGSTGQIISTINPNGTITQANYDTQGNKLNSTDVLGRVTTFTYDVNNNLLTIKDALGNVTQNTYNAQDRLLSSTNALGEVATFAYNLDGTLSSSVDARGNETGANPLNYTTNYQYTNDLLTQTTDQLGNTNLSILDALGRVIADKDALNHVTNISYNDLNLPTKITNPLSSEEYFTYDNMGNTLTSKDALGNITSYTYDLTGNLLTQTNALNHVTSYAYDSMDRVIGITNANGKISSYFYDSFGQLTQVTDPLGNITKQEWDKSGNLVSTIDAGNNKTTYRYDLIGNVVAIIDPLNNITRNEYNVMGNIIKTINDDGSFYTYEYDVLGRKAKIISPDLSFESITYDSVGNIISKTNKLGKINYWSYDSRNNKTQYIDELGKITNYSYDELSQLTKKMRSDQSVIGYAYNSLGALTDTTYPDSSLNTSYAYNIRGQVISEQKGTGAESTYSYDAIGQLIARGPPNNRIQYTYDNIGNVSSLTYPSGRVVNYQYNDNAELAGLDTTGINAIAYSYNSRGLNTGISLPNGVANVTEYDANARIVNKSVTKDAINLYERSITYDSVNNISQRTTIIAGNSTTENYSYDLLKRLTEQKDSTTQSLVNGYSYNTAGNLIGVNGSNQIYDDSGKILSSEEAIFTYDSLNNRTATSYIDEDKNESYAWNSNGELKSATRPAISSGVVDDEVIYTYGLDSLLETRSLNGVKTNDFVWDNSTTIPLLLSDGDYEYIYGNDRIPLAQINTQTNTVTYLHTDLNGSIATSTTSTGVLGNTIEYSPYGERTGSSQSNFGYAGEWTDATTGSTYLRARWLDTKTGTFLSEDPLKEATGNGFGYTNGNPLSQTDPLGLCNPFTGDLFNIASNCYSFADTNIFQGISDTAAGFGDGATAGLTSSINSAIGSDNVINKKSSAYVVGGFAGTVASSLVPGGSAGKAAIKGASKTINTGNKLKNSDIDDIVKNSTSQKDDSAANCATVESYLPPGFEKKLDENAIGIIYYRYDTNGLVAPYVGQSKSPESYIKRQAAHKNNQSLNGSNFHFEVIANAIPNSGKGVKPKTRGLSHMEEYMIRQLGGLEKEGGLLSNDRHEMAEKRYQLYGGDF